MALHNCSIPEKMDASLVIEGIDPKRILSGQTLGITTSIRVKQEKVKEGMTLVNGTEPG